jgi:hypothetical protein
VADHPLKPAIDRSLGRPLPHQQTNLTRAHLLASACKQRHLFIRRYYSVLIRISPGYPQLSGRFPRVTHPSATRQQRSKLLSVTVRLACVRHTASVQSEPGSNSSINFAISINTHLIYCGKLCYQFTSLTTNYLSKKLRDSNYGHLSLYLKYIISKCPHKLSIKLLIYIK